MKFRKNEKNLFHRAPNSKKHYIHQVFLCLRNGLQYGFLRKEKKKKRGCRSLQTVAVVLCSSKIFISCTSEM